MFLLDWRRSCTMTYVGTDKLWKLKNVIQALCVIKVSVIKDSESGKATPNEQTINKLNRARKVNLPSTNKNRNWWNFSDFYTTEVFFQPSLYILGCLIYVVIFELLFGTSVIWRIYLSHFLYTYTHIHTDTHIIYIYKKL